MLIRLSGAEPISHVNYRPWLFTSYKPSSVHGLENCTQNSERSGIAFTIYTNQFKLPKNDRGGLKLVSKVCFEEMEHEFPSEKDRTTFSEVPLLPQIFRWNDPTQDVLFHLLSNRIFWKLFENGKQPIITIIKKIWNPTSCHRSLFQLTYAVVNWLTSILQGISPGRTCFTAGHLFSILVSTKRTFFTRTNAVVCGIFSGSANSCKDRYLVCYLSHDLHCTRITIIQLHDLSIFIIVLLH